MSQWTAMSTVALATLFASFLAADAGQRDSTISQLSWLAGCWESTGGDRRTEEQWMSPRGGTMLGMSRTVVGDKTRAFESMRIQEEDGQLVLSALPSGQAEATFRSIELTRTRVVFENKTHDFPQRISYQLNKNGALLARIEGERAGVLDAVEFPMSRTRCPGSGGH